MTLDDEREGDELLARHEPEVVDQKLHQLLNNSHDRSLLSFLFGALIRLKKKRLCFWGTERARFSGKTVAKLLSDKTKFSAISSGFMY